MKDRKLDALSRRYLLPRMQGFAASRGLVFERPLEFLLRGFCYDKSGFDPHGFYIWVFVQPLFVPDSAVTFSMGDRIREKPGGVNEYWSLEEASEEKVMDDVYRKISKQGFPFLKKFRTLGVLAHRAVSHNNNPHDLYAPEMAAYAAILINDARSAMKMFDFAEKRYEMDDDRRDWIVALMERIRMVRKSLEHNAAEAVSILHQWRLETARNLKLEEFLAPVLAV